MSDAIRLYDVHTHVGLDLGFYLRGWWPYAATVQDLLQHMDANGIGQAVCFPFTLPSAFDLDAFAERGAIELQPGRVPFDRENRRLVDEVRRIDLEHRLMPLAMFDPARNVAEQVANIEALSEHICGLKTQTTILESPIRVLLDEGRELMALAAERDLPVLLHASVQPSAVHAQVADCLAVAEAFPEVRFNLAHSLGFHEHYLRRAAEMPNVWVDCAAHLANCGLALEDSSISAPRADRVDADFTQPPRALEAVHAILGGKYMWGSDNPYMSWCDDTLRIFHSYRAEAAVLHALRADVRRSMASTAPTAWLTGNAGAST